MIPQQISIGTNTNIRNSVGNNRYLQIEPTISQPVSLRRTTLYEPADLLGRAAVEAAAIARCMSRRKGKNHKDTSSRAELSQDNVSVHLHCVNEQPKQQQTPGALTGENRVPTTSAQDLISLCQSKHTKCDDSDSNCEDVTSKYEDVSNYDEDDDRQNYSDARGLPLFTVSDHTDLLDPRDDISYGNHENELVNQQDLSLIQGTNVPKNSPKTIHNMPVISLPQFNKTSVRHETRCGMINNECDNNNMNTSTTNREQVLHFEPPAIYSDRRDDATCTRMPFVPNNTETLRNNALNYIPPHLRENQRHCHEDNLQYSRQCYICGYHVPIFLQTTCCNVPCHNGCLVLFPRCFVCKRSTKRDQYVQKTRKKDTPNMVVSIPKTDEANPLGEKLKGMNGGIKHPQHSRKSKHKQERKYNPKSSKSTWCCFYKTHYENI